MKRAAAAALALSVALSAAAPAALAKEYDISKGDITVTVKDNGDTYVLVGKAKDENDIGVIDDTAVVIKGGEDPDKPAGNNSDGPADKDTADEAEGQKPVVDAEPGEPAEETGTELVVWPENVNSGEAQKKDEPAEEEPETPDTQKPEGKTDADTLEASTEQKPVEKAAEDEDDDKDIMTFEDNTASTVTKAVSKAVHNIITIINNCTKKDTTVTIKDVNINGYDPHWNDYGDNKAAMYVKGAGDTTLKLEGDNTLRGGYHCAGLEKDDEFSTGKLTITAEDTNASLKARGGFDAAGIGGGYGQSTSKLEIANGKIDAKGDQWGAGIGGGIYGNGEVTISGGDVNAYGDIGAAGIGGGCEGSGKVTIKNGKVTAKTFDGAASIGGGRNGSGDVTILNGTVTTTKNNDYYPVTGIGGAPDSKKKSIIRILGGVVNAVGASYGSGIGGDEGDVEVEIGGGAQVTAKGGLEDDGYGAGAAIGTNGEKGGKAGKELDVNAIGAGTVTRIDSKLPDNSEHKHEWTLVSSTPAAVGQLGEKVYECSSCDSTRTVYEPALPAPVEEQNGRVVLRVIDAPYEMHQESARYIVTADSDTATLFGCLGNLAELKEQGVDTLVFRTESRETALDIDTMLSLGTEDTIFTLTHSGSSATLTVGGADHSELIH